MPPVCQSSDVAANVADELTWFGRQAGSRQTRLPHRDKNRRPQEAGTTFDVFNVTLRSAVPATEPRRDP